MTKDGEPSELSPQKWVAIEFAGRYRFGNDSFSFVLENCRTKIYCTGLRNRTDGGRGWNRVDIKSPTTQYVRGIESQD